ncbi:hypothetical protein ANCCAN_21509 [Ancylostoma caninum]|uniref:Uncharacterized protein n=1 Tax=Ancylostoma caninum TaxID=29170 RepID=A0A368FKJ0_ANCCA|nr:hypothetical protein ANCCAN_21509 [Ancylostoma caninum]
MCTTYTSMVLLFLANRELKCEYYGGNNTRCTLVDPQLIVDQNPGCFEELNESIVA